MALGNPAGLAGAPLLLHDAAMRRAPAAAVASILLTAGCTFLVPLDDLAGDAETGESGASETDAPNAAEGNDAARDATADHLSDRSADALGDASALSEAAADVHAPPAPEAAVEADALVREAASVADAPMPEASSEADAPLADVAQEADAPLHFCASLPTPAVLCEDFDEGTAFNAQFSTTVEGAPGHIGADSAYAKTAPDSLFSNLDQGMSSAFAYLRRAFSGTSSRIDYAFDVLLVQAASGDSVVAAAVLVDEGLATQHQITLVIGSTREVEQSFVGAGGKTVFVDTALAAWPSPGLWSHVDMVVSLATQTVSVTVDGASALANAPLDPSWPAAGPMTINIGIAYASGTAGPWSLRFDDVVANPQ
jgi:hypothetical protein